MRENIIQEKSFNFALRVIKLFQYLVKNKKEFVLSKQILRSGTAIGANIEEALGGQSRKDFLNKISIAYKEARETSYWLRLLNGAEILSEHHFLSMHQDLEEIIKILTTIQKTTKSNS